MISQARTALVHEWLTDWGGSEDVTRLMLESLPQAQLHATIDFLSEEHRARLGGGPIQTTFLQRAPFVQKKFWNYLPLTGLAVERHDLDAFDIIVSNSHAFAKGVITRGDQLHVSYVQSPMRYAWDLNHQYLRDYGLDKGVKGLMAHYMFHRLRAWDRQTANNVDLFLANSRYIQQRVWRTYRRRSRVLYPPVRTSLFALQPHKEDFYVTVSRLVSYKRIDLLVEAFAAMPQRKLVVIGDGPEAQALKLRCPANVTLMGWQSDEVVRQHLGSARAFLFAALEDFGISPLEAQACGTPVIAYGKGGATETVRDLHAADRPTGLLFPEQTTACIVEAVEAFEAAGVIFDPHACRTWAETFSEERFKREFKICVDQAWDVWRRQPQELESILTDGP